MQDVIKVEQEASFGYAFRSNEDVCPMHRSSQNNSAVPSSHDSCTGAQTSESRRTCTEAESSVPFFTGMIISSFAANANIVFHR